MSSITTITELRTMQMDDLERDINEQVTIVQTLKMGIRLAKEKDTAKLRRARRQLARMETVRTEKKRELRSGTKKSTVSASKS